MSFATPEHFPQCLQALEHGTGMVGDHRLIRRSITKNDRVATEGARELHMVEALLGGVIVAQGQRIEDIYTTAYQRIMRRLGAYAAMVGRFLLLTKRTRKNLPLIKVCKIPVFSMKLPAE